MNKARQLGQRVEWFVDSDSPSMVSAHLPADPWPVSA
jgi:hypothetical protein